MRPHASSSGATGHGEARDTPAWKNLAVAGLPVLACFLGGATEKWAEGAIVALLGLLLLVNPPRFSLGWMLNAICLGLAASAALAFLPARFVRTPAWRTALTDDFGIALPASITPQPWITLGAFLSLIAGLCWLYYVATQELELRAVRRQLRFFAGGIVLLAGICILLKWAHAAPQFWHNQRGFGPFPNRNQTANVLGLAAIVVLACGQDSIRRNTKAWIFWLLAFGIVVSAIVLNFSRAGVLIVVIGSALWIAGFAFRKGSASVVAVGLSLLLLLVSAMLLFGGQTVDRFHLRGDDVDNFGLSGDFRWLIFRDAMELIRVSPLTGIGLGNFEPVFAIFRDASAGNTRALHPESDWLWLLSEAGWLSVLLVLVGLGVFVWRVFPLQEGTNQRFRRAALIGALLFAVHGVFDVSGHRVGTVFSAIFLLGLSLFRPLPLPRNPAIPWAFRSLGIVLLVAGSSWMWAAHSSFFLPGGLGAENAIQAATLANRSRNFAEAVRTSTRAADWAPLDWQIYFLRAVARIALREPAENALSDFRRARFLEPNSYELPLEEGKIWIQTHPMLAITAWREALRRAGPEQNSLYSYLLSIAPLTNPEVDRGLGTFALGKPDLMLVYLGRLSPENFEAAIARFLAQNPNLNGLTTAEKTRLLTVWGERGNRKTFAAAIDAHPDWLPLAWRSMAEYRASTGDFRAAFELARRFGKSPALPPSSDDVPVEELRRSVATGTNNYAAGFALYSLQMRNGQSDDALNTIRHFTDAKECPAYFHYLAAECWAAKGDWARGWKARLAYEAAAQRQAIEQLERVTPLTRK